jgi:DME family drug/metabolite transporter
MAQAEQARSGAWFVLMAATLWGTTGTAQAFAPAGFDPLVIGTLRLAIGGGAMLLLVLLQGGFAQLRGWPIKITIAAALFTALYQVCFFAGVAKTGVAVGTIVGIGSAPVAGGILGYLFRGERPGRNWFIATALAIVGCVFLVFSSGGEVKIDPFGVTLAIGAGVAYAAYTLVFKRLLEQHKPIISIAVVFTLGSLMLSPLMIGRNLDWLVQPRGIGVILHLGLVTAALAYWLFARGLQRVPVASAMTLTLAEPLTAGLLGLLVLGEQLNPIAFAGIALIFCGLAVLSFAGKPVPDKPADFAG